VIQKLQYFIREGFPGDRAHHVQIAHQVWAFSAEGMASELVVPFMPEYRPEAIARRYGLPGSLTLRPIASGRGLPKVARDFLYRRALVSFVKEAPEGVAFYGRSSGKLPMPVVLDLKHKGRTFVEVHSGDLDHKWEKLLKRAHGVVCISDALRDHLIRRGLAADRIVVARDGVHLEAYARKVDRKSLGVPDDLPWVVFTGHLYADRGAEVILQAVPLTQKKCHWVLVGGTPEDVGRVRWIAKKENLLDRVHFTGMKAPSEVPAYQMAASALLMPYRSSLSTAAWCSPLKLFEYMAAGAPIVSSDLPTIREVLRHGQNALMVPPDDPRALAAAVDRLLSDASLSASLSGCARREVERFTWRNRAKVILEFIKNRSR
jgi:glycosyltransferase involved in cell wall biosynthesis